jgi:hypothetical protein
MNREEKSDMRLSIVLFCFTVIYAAITFIIAEKSFLFWLAFCTISLAWILSLVNFVLAVIERHPSNDKRGKKVMYSEETPICDSIIELHEEVKKQVFNTDEYVFILGGDVYLEYQSETSWFGEKQSRANELLTKHGHIILAYGDIKTSNTIMFIDKKNLATEKERGREGRMIICENNEKQDERIHACDVCGKMRTKDEGGTVFTVCDDCWERANNEVKTNG